MKNSPHAFPQTHPDNALIYLDRGMSLRDYFAAKAMQGFLASGSMAGIEMIEMSYEIADCMLEVRNNERK